MVGKQPLSRLSDALPKPLGELVFGELARRQIGKDNDDLGICGAEHMAIQIEKAFRNDRCRSLIAVHERMIARQAECIAGRKCRSIGFAVGGEILRPRHCALECTFITNASGAAPFRQLFVVRGESFRAPDPNPRNHWFRYLASSRSALRLRRMTSRSTSICRSKSASYGRSSIPSAVLT